MEEACLRRAESEPSDSRESLDCAAIAARSRRTGYQGINGGYDCGGGGKLKIRSQSWRQVDRYMWLRSSRNWHVTQAEAHGDAVTVRLNKNETILKINEYLRSIENQANSSSHVVEHK